MSLATRSEQFSILDEARPLRELVIKPPRRRVRFLRQPVDPGSALLFGPLVYGFDQPPPNSAAARVLGGEKVLQIAIRTLGPCRAVEDVMHDADNLAIAFGDKRMHWLGVVEEAREGQIGDVVRYRRFVEREIALPKRLPLRAVGSRKRAGRDLVHGSSAN